MKYVDKGVFSIEKAESIWKKLLEVFYPDGKDTIFAVFSQENDEYLEHVAIRPRSPKQEDREITYFLKTSTWGKGYATEIAKRLVELGFDDLKLSEVFATIDDENLNSIKVIEKSGMSFSRHEFDEDERTSIYSIKRTNYLPEKLSNQS